MVYFVEPFDCNSNSPEESAVVATPPEPVNALIVEAIIYPYNITHRCPEGTVTVTPGSKVIGPTDIPFDPAVIV